MGQTKPFGKGFGQKGGLIIATFAFSLPVERYRHDDVCFEGFLFALNEFGQSIGKPPSQRFDLLELQKKNCSD